MSSSTRPQPLDTEALIERLRVVDRRITFVSARIFRQVGGRAAASLERESIGHRPAMVVSLEKALAAARPDELGLEQPESDVPGNTGLMLLERPDPGWLASSPEWLVLTRYWRAIFHAMAHEALSGLGLSETEAVQSIDRLGRARFAEARAVLEEEGRLTRDDSDREAWIEFAASFLELKTFDPTLCRLTFPEFCHCHQTTSTLDQLVDSQALLERSRPLGAVDPQDQSGSESSGESDDLEPPREPETAERGARMEKKFRELCQRAETAAQAGNDVRAAIEWTRAANLARSGNAGQANASSLRAINRLAVRLQAATGGEDSEAHAWAAALEPLRQPATPGYRSASARLLYDLQLAAIEVERPASKVEILDWLLSFGRRSARRPLPNHSEAQIVRHLRGAVARLGRVRVSEKERKTLAGLLHRALDRAEAGLRDRFRPLITRSLERADLRPGSLPERVAFEKLVEEQLDRVVEKGFLTAGDVRDALSRNAMKLPDLTATDLVRGDPFLRTDRRLGVALDGIYRRAECYLRGLQKFSSLAFGTALGRVLTLWIALPFGVAFVLLEGLQHLIEPLLALLRGELALLGGAHPAPGPTGHHGPRLLNPASFSTLSLLFLALIHSSGFRQATGRFLLGLWGGLRALCVDLPRSLVNIPSIAAILASPLARGLWNWLLRPGLAAGFAAGLAQLRGHQPGITAAVFGLVYLVTVWLTASRLGRLLEADLRERLRHSFDHIRFNLVPGIYQFIMSAFSWALEALDRFFYAVDEVLRFRSGESRFAFVAKALGGGIWAVFSYIVRTIVNLLIEPQLNPIKHFPVVTVAHKITLPFMLALPKVLTAAPLSMSPVTASGLAFALQLLIPGVFGFLVWELKENWRLYSANRATSLRPVPVGSHGETVVRLLRPGLHSGTVARAFARLRRQHGAPPSPRRSRAIHKQREALIHVEHAIGNFVDRELLGLLRLSHHLGATPLSVDHAEALPRRLRIGVRHGQYPADPLTITFQEENDWLVARLDRLPDWFQALDQASRNTFAMALAGLYHRAGVELVDEQIAHALADPGICYEIGRRGLRVWIPGPVSEVLEFPLRDVSSGSCQHGQSSESSVARRLRFRLHPIGWDTWVEAWSREPSGEPASRLTTYDILPAPEQPAQEQCGSALSHARPQRGPAGPASPDATTRV